MRPEYEMNRRVIFIGVGIVIVLVAVIAVAWMLLPPAPTLVPASADSKCANCHGDMDRLTELSEKPDRYYVDPVQFAQESHSGLACTTCHAGDPTKDKPEEACLNGKAYNDPAAKTVVEKTCGSCHPEITARHLNSIHVSLEGIRTSLVDLMGEKDGNFKFYATCNDCHTTCSSCHMDEPDRRNMLWPRVTNHHFETKSNSKTCVACHAGMGDTFFGTKTAPKHEPSMMAQAGMQCVDCHGDKDVHGTGVKTSFSMQTPKPTCEECHNQPASRITSAKDTLVAPQYSEETTAHQIHSEDLVSCEACHTQWYPSCWNCHDGRTDKTIEKLYLAVSPLRNQIMPAAHSPAVSGATGPIPSSMGGGWAIKTRHSWGASQSCEACHTDISVYISGPDRQAPFVGYWAKNHANASFVDEKFAQILTIDKTKLAASLHKDQKCDDCHKTVTDGVCAECHTKTKKSGKTFLAGDADWSRNNYIAAEQNLEKSADMIKQAKALGMDVASWQRDYDALKINYLQVSNDFHANPGQALATIKTVNTNSVALLGTFQQSVQARQIQNQFLPPGLLIVFGTLGAVVVSFFARRQQKG